ncbi:hypothetical protein F8161_22430 [Bacillus cereus]|uniref:hypothetical protein n=1 Tax=Bacillus cereus TaxID=1396 RepID=UPI00124EEB4D|nr:hypothetical protein [Bacillus cereus]KAB2456278.1 hypothetical protein F8161_22430 [Bacillus cereus]
MKLEIGKVFFINVEIRNNSSSSMFVNDNWNSFFLIPCKLFLIKRITEQGIFEHVTVDEALTRGERLREYFKA